MPLWSAVEALELLEARRVFGTIVLAVDERRRIRTHSL
jgi:hypothetical protein